MICNSLWLIYQGVIPMTRRSMLTPKIKIIYHVIPKILETCYFQHSGHAWPQQWKTIESNLQAFEKLLFWQIVKIMQTCLCTFGMPDQTTQKNISTRRKLWCLLACKKSVHLSLLCWDIARFWKFVTSGNLSLTGHAYRNW